MDEENERIQRHNLVRNVIAFWILGLCNNFAYVVMLSAAKDILENNSTNPAEDGKCIVSYDDIKCSKISTGAVLLADIIPSLIVKLLSPFLLHSIPYSIRHTLVVFLQSSCLVIVAFSRSYYIGLLGVVFASAGSGLGEVSYLSLSAHFSSDVVSSWASGTGGAGIVGALSFAVMTDKRILALSARTALLIMLIVPFTLWLTFSRILVFPATIRRINVWRFYTNRASQPRIEGRRNYHQIDDVEVENVVEEVEEEERLIAPLILPLPNAEALLLEVVTCRDADIRRSSSVSLSAATRSFEGMCIALRQRLRMIRPLLKFMVPLFVVYFAEYFINQGLLELLVFTCTQGFHLSPAAQYRWYQVLYQVGVFISRSSAKVLPVSVRLLPMLPILQIINAVLLFNDALYPHVDHIMVVFLIVFYEGLLGGCAYANTFSNVHRTVQQQNREFSMAMVAMSDALGIMLAGFSSIFVHNFICSQPRRHPSLFSLETAQKIFNYI